MSRMVKHLIIACGGASVVLAAACQDRVPSEPTALRPNAPSLSSGSGSSGSGSGGSVSAISVSSASLQGTTLSVQGSGARGGASIWVNGTVMGSASSTGTCNITNPRYTSTSCTITVSDGRTSTKATLSPCSPSGGSSTPAANVPKPLSPAAGSSVLQPVTLSWSTPTTSTPIVGYNWQLSTRSDFATIAYQNSVNAPGTQDSFSGMPNGAYFWRVQAVEQGNPTTGLIQDPWSAGVSFTIAGSAAGTPATPALTFPANGAQYHPWESFYPRWAASTGAASYVVEYGGDAGFTPSKILFTRQTTSLGDTITFGNPLSVWVRVRGLAANGLRGLPSNAVQVTITYTAPIGPPPTLLDPINGASAQLPYTFRWTDVQNPQLEGYQLEIASEPTFKGDCPGIEYCNLQITGTAYTVLSANQDFTLPKGTHYWRVRSMQGNSSPTLPALTAWSPVGTFTVP
jgi:hypothetical protein